MSEQKEPAAILIGRDTARLGGEAGARKASGQEAEGISGSNNHNFFHEAAGEAIWPE